MSGVRSDALIDAADIAAAARRLQGHVLRTPLRRSDWLSSAAEADVYLKLETLQPTFSFKVRGATNAVLVLSERGASGRLVTASAGNHGRGLARAASSAGFPLTVYVPAGAPRVKIDALRASGAEIRVCESYDAAERQAQESARESGATYVAPYSDPDVIAGAGTVGLEILEDLPDVEAIVVPVGGGGLLSGVAIAARASGSAVFGVEADASTPFTHSLAAGRVVPISVRPTLADGLAGNLDPLSITFEIVRQLAAGVLVVTEAGIRDAIRGLFAEERLVAEGAAAAAVAALLSGPLKDPRPRSVAVVLSGANIDPQTLRGII